MRGDNAGWWRLGWRVIQEQSCVLAPPPPCGNAVRGSGTGTRAVRWVRAPPPRVHFTLIQYCCLWWTGRAITTVGPQVCQDLVSVATVEDHTRIGGSTEDALW
eukprot:1926981-Rhodomonas_salina.1